jgi:hypothetical protein
MSDQVNETAVQDMTQAVQGLAQWAQSLTVQTQADANAALTRLAEIKGQRKLWVAYWEPIKSAANAAWKGIVAKEKEGTDVADQAEAIVKAKIGAYNEAQRRLAEAEQRRLQAQADEAARKERERNEAVARYSLLADSEQVFASRYQPWLPTEAELQAELTRDRTLLENAQPLPPRHTD